MLALFCFHLQVLFPCFSMPRSLEFTSVVCLAHWFPVANRSGRGKRINQSIYLLFCFMWSHPRLALLMQVITLLKVTSFTWQINHLHISFHAHTFIYIVHQYFLAYIYWGSFVANYVRITKRCVLRHPWSSLVFAQFLICIYELFTNS